MKNVTGQFISEIYNEIHSAISADAEPNQLLSQIKSTIDSFYRIHEIDSTSFSPSHNVRESLSSADPGEVSRLNALLPWSTYTPLNGAHLGNIFNQSKRPDIAIMPDKVIKRLDQLLSLNHCTVCESGCFEGVHSISLAMMGAKVFSFDARIEHIAKSLIRAWAYGFESKIKFDLLNLEMQSVKTLYSALNKIDLYHCRGVLYHLSDPVSYLLDIIELNPSAIYIHSQVSTPDQAIHSINTQIGPLKGFKFGEAGRAAPFAGTENYAFWLQPHTIVEILSSGGYAKQLINCLTAERNGDRLELLVTR